MKKTVCMFLAAILICTFAMAESVFVTICNDLGEPVVAAEAFDVSDADGDGVVSVSDALFAAHEAKFEGGAAAGFEAADVGYGLSLLRLWGVENGGSYGYYVNNASAFSLLDAVSEGDVVCAFAYTDLETWSDTYSYFDITHAVNTGEISLTLTAIGFDADFNPVEMPVEGAVITINGVDTEFVTDANGAVTITLGEVEEYVISAHSETMTLVPPVCVVNGSVK